MPGEQLTSCDTVPDGFTHVIDAGTLMPSLPAHSVATSMVYSRISSRNFASSSQFVDMNVLSMIPVKDTPSRRSSSAFFCHSLRRYRNSVNVDCRQPMMVAMRTLRLIDALVSCARRTTSDRLQKPLGRKLISPQGLVPNSMPSHLRRPVFLALLVA